MSRRRQAIKRSVIADAKYNSVLVGRLVNTVMFSGQKNVARRIVYGAIEALAEKTPGVDPLEIVQRAIDNAKPRIETKARRAVVPPIRFRWKSPRIVRLLWPCAGSLDMRMTARAFR